MSPAQPGLLMFASIPASILGGKTWTDCTHPVACCRSGSGLGRARLPSTSCACISQGNQGSFQGQAALLGQVCHLKVRDVQSVTSETKHHTQPACREQSVLAPKLSKNLAWKDGQGTGNCATLEVTMSWERYQHGHCPSAKVLLQHDARRYRGTHSSLGVQK